MSAITTSSPSSLPVTPTVMSHAGHDMAMTPPAAAAAAAVPAAAVAPSTQAGAGAAALAPNDQQALLASLLSVLTTLVGALQAQSGAGALGGGAATLPQAATSPAAPAAPVVPTGAAAVAPQQVDTSLDSLWTQAVQQTPTQAPVAPVAGGGASPQLTGTFRAGAKATSGTASVVTTAAGGKELDISRLQTDAGPDLHVYLAANHPTTDAGVTDYIDLGKLPTNAGDSKLAIPAGTDLSKYNDVVVWCAMAKTTFGSAQLS